MTSGGIGSVSVKVVPDADHFWNEFRRRTEPGASEAGRAAGRRVREGMEGELARPVDVRVNANTNDVQNATRQTNLLRDAILLLGPAAIPVAGVLTGGLAGVVPVAATLALGIKGISDELKSGQLAGTQFAADVSSLKTEFITLKGVAAGGLLSGLDQALQASSPLFGALNQDIGYMSKQLGQIVAGAAPALLNILNALNPLFVTFGNLIAAGAGKLEHFAASSTGIQSFVAYVQTELPTVVHAIGQLVEFVGHLVQALEPFGHVILSGIGLLATALNAIPQGVLTDLASGALAAYAAFRTYGAISGVVNSISGALTKFTAANFAAAQQVRAAALLTENSKRQEAVAVAEANLAEARSAQLAAEGIAAAATEAGAAEAGIARIAATQAAAFTTAQEEKVAAARAAAAQISAAAVAEAEVVTTESRAVSIGLGGLLGPIGAVVVGVGLLFGVMNSTNQAEQQMTENVNSLTTALVASKGALDETIRSNVTKTLSDEGAYTIASKLKIGQDELTTAILSGGAALDKVRGKIREALASGKEFAAEGFFNKKPLDKSFEDEITALSLAAKAAHDQQVALDGGTVAVLRNAHAFHTTADAYLSAQEAAQKNIDKTREQTLQFQLENDAGSLLQQTLDKLSGKNLGYAQSLNSFQQSLVSLASGLQAGHTAVTGLSQAAIANRGALLSGVSAAEQAAEAYGKMTGSSASARSKLVELRQQLIDNAVAHGEDRDAVTAYIDSVLKIPASVPPTAIDVKTAAATSKVDALKARIAAIKQGKVPGVDVNSREAQGLIRQLQAQIDRLNGKRLTFYVDANLSPAMQAAIRFAANPANANSQPTSRVFTQAVGTSAAFGQRTIPPNSRFTVGEGADHTWEYGVSDSQGKVAIFSNAQSKAMGVPTPTRYATGTGVVTLDPYTGQAVGGGSDVVSLTPKKSSSSTHKVHIVYMVEGHQYASYLAASNAAVSKYKADVALGVKIDTKDLDNFKSKLSGTAAAANAAFQTLLADANKLGLSSGLAAHLQAENKQLDKAINDRNKTADALAAVKQKFADEKQAVKSAITGAFDISTAGAGLDGKVTGAGILAQQTQAANRVRTFVKDLEAAKGKGISKTYLQQLAEKGPDALPEVEAILTLNKTQIGQLNATSAAIYAQGDKLGGYVAGQMYGGSIATLTAREKTDDVFIDKMGKKIAAEVRSAVAGLADRPVVIKVNDREIARATASGVLKNARRS